MAEAKAETNAEKDIEPTIPSVAEIVRLIQERFDLVGHPVSVIVKANLTMDQCKQIYRAFPIYKHCIRSGFGSHVKLTLN